MRSFKIAIGPRTWVVIGSLFIIGILFGAYFTLYIPSQENAFIKRGFRILSQMGDNISERNLDYQKLAEKKLFIPDEVKKIAVDNYFQNSERKNRLVKLEAEKAGLRVTLNQQHARSFAQQSPDFPGLSSTPKININEILRSNNIIQEKLNEVKDKIRFSQKEINDQLNAAFNKISQDNIIIDHVKPVSKNNFVSYQQTLNPANFKSEHHEDSTISLFMMVPIQQYMKPILRNDAFDEFLIVREDSIVFQTLKNQLGFDKKMFDSLFSNSKGLKGANIIPIQSSNQDYHVFVHRMTFENYLEATFESWYLCGLISKDNYRQEIQQVESFVLINAGLGLLFLLMGMPLLKLLLMSPIERLYISNVVWIGVSLVFGTSLLTMLFLSGYSFLELKFIQIDNQLKVLSEEVNSSFQREIVQNYSLLEQFDQLLDDNALISDSQQSAVGPTAFNVFNSDSLSHSIKNKVGFNHLFWTDLAGDLKLVFTPFQVSDTFPNINISERTYYSDIIKQQVWSLPTNSEKKFAMQSIFSWADHTLELGVSKQSQSEKYPVLAITSNPHSVMDPVLPPGYGFSLINEEGLVLFHSDSRKNLQENFLEETNGNNILNSLLEGNVAKHASLKYLNKWHRMYVVPVKNIPLDLVVFYDLDYIKLPIGQTIAVTLSLICFLFLLVVIVMGILFTIQYRFKKLRIKHFYLDWMNPKKNIGYKYRLLVAGNLIIILFWVLLGVITDGDQSQLGLDHFDQVFLVTITPLYLLILNYLILKEISPKSFIATVICLLVFLTLLNLTYHSYFSRNASNTLDILNCFVLLVYQGLYIFFLAAIYRRIQVAANKVAPNKSTDWVSPTYQSRFPVLKRIKSYIDRRAFNLFLVTWLVISSIIPVLFYFKFALSTEQQIWQKHAQLTIAQGLQTRNYSLDQEFQNRLIGSQDPDNPTNNFRNCFLDKKKYAGLYFKQLGYKTKSDYGEKNLLHDHSNLDNLLFYLRPPYSQLVAETKAFAFHRSSDSMWVWTLDEEQRLRLKYQAKDPPPTILTSQLDLSAVHYFMRQEHLDFAIPLWMLIIALIVTQYKLIGYAVRRIYAQDFENVHSNELVDLDYLELKEVNNRVFITGLPYSGKWKLIEDYKMSLQIEGTAYQIKDCRQLNDRGEVFGDPTDSKVVILKNFEYNINDHESLKAKLKILEELLDRSKQIVISSEIHPKQIVVYYQTMINKIQHLQFEQEFRAEYQEYRHHYKLWQQILRGFIKVYHHLSTQEVELSGNYSDGINQLVKSELEFGYYLSKLEPLVHQYYKNLKITCDQIPGARVSKEDIILKIQSLAESYYHSIWNSFSKSEKYLIFDLAKDRFVNVKNDSAIKTLLSKGVFQYLNNLKLMNTSFNNFVLKVVDSDQEIMMEKELRKKGKWSSIQLVLILAIISIIVFIVLGQKNFLNQFNSLVGAIAAVVGLLFRFGGMFTHQPLNGKSGD